MRRSPWAVAAAVVLAVLLWWFTSSPETSTEPVTDTDASSQVAPAAQDSPTGPTASPDGAQGAQSPPASGQDGAEVPTRDEHGLDVVLPGDLPREAREVFELIDAGGPYEHPDKDGSRFGNYEGVLPSQRGGYYREYTVPTPGIDHRGARRIVTGEGGEFYWTADHYATFERIWR